MHVTKTFSLGTPQAQAPSFAPGAVGCGRAPRLRRPTWRSAQSDSTRVSDTTYVAWRLINGPVPPGAPRRPKRGGAPATFKKHTMFLQMFGETTFKKHTITHETSVAFSASRVPAKMLPPTAHEPLRTELQRLQRVGVLREECPRNHRVDRVRRAMGRCLAMSHDADFGMKAARQERHVPGNWPRSSNQMLTSVRKVSATSSPNWLRPAAPPCQVFVFHLCVFANTFDQDRSSITGSDSAPLACEPRRHIDRQ